MALTQEQKDRRDFLRAEMDKMEDTSGDTGATAHLSESEQTEYQTMFDEWRYLMGDKDKE